MCANWRTSSLTGFVLASGCFTLSVVAYVVAHVLWRIDQELPECMLEYEKQGATTRRPVKPPEFFEKARWVTRVSFEDWLYDVWAAWARFAQTHRVNFFVDASRLHCGKAILVYMTQRELLHLELVGRHQDDRFVLFMHPHYDDIANPGAFDALFYDMENGTTVAVCACIQEGKMATFPRATPVPSPATSSLTTWRTKEGYKVNPFPLQRCTLWGVQTWRSNYSLPTFP